jgi:hypothetical protein
MLAVSVQITGFVDGAFPGVVSCTLQDVQKRTWQFVEKVPVVSLAPLTDRSQYPQPGEIRCRVLSRSLDPSGRALVRIDTSGPDSVESTDGNTIFEVFAEQLIEVPGDA